MKANICETSEFAAVQKTNNGQLATVFDMHTSTNYDAIAKPSILLAEEDDVTAYMLTYLLEREGYEVTHAADGKAAHELINSNNVYSLVLLDVMIPFKSGFELIADMRAIPELDDTPVIVISGKSQERDIVEALDAGAADYIVKPFKPGEVLARIRKSIVV